MILIVTADADSSADHVSTRLRARGVEVQRFNPADYPVRASLSFALDPHGHRHIVIEDEHRRIDLDEVDAVWFRRPETPRPDARLADMRMRRYVVEECHAHLEDVWNALPCPAFPAVPAVMARAALKLSQLGVAGELGFELPPTLVTTRPAALLDFHRRHDGRIISKLAGPTMGRFYGPEVARYTEPVTTRDIGYVEAVRLAPAIFQASVDKRVELRITVVGERVFPVEIHSQDAARTRGDWRRYDLGLTPHRLHALPEEVSRRCTQLVRRLGLAYGAIDMILTPEGRYVFIEINPNGQFLWIEQLVNAGIGEAIAEHLAAQAQARARLPAVVGAQARRPSAATRNRTHECH
jgi:hypothetical protein